MPKTRTANDWCSLAVSLYEQGEAIDADLPGALAAHELFVRAGAAASIAIAINTSRAKRAVKSSLKS